MFSAIRRRLHVSPATVIASLALVFAMTGGAYAASKYVITSTKQIKPTVLKSLTGRAGPVGKNGANGVNGAQGLQGPAGSTGAKGETGPQGPEGKTGEQGEPGTNGTTGFTSTLPPEKTETGAWSMSGSTTSTEEGVDVAASVSFSIPLAEELDIQHVHYITSGEKELVETATGSFTFKEQASSACLGNAQAPLAAPGNLCVYESFANGFEESPLVTTGSVFRPQIIPAGGKPKIFGGNGEGAGTSGVTLINRTKAKAEAYAWGSWAVSAPE